MRDEKTTVAELTIGVVVVAAVVLSLVPGLATLQVLLVPLVLVAIIAGWSRLGRGVRLAALISVGAGVTGAVAAGATITEWAAGTTQMASIFAFFVLVRLLEVPLLSGRFHHALARLSTDRLGIRGRAAAGTMVTYGLASGLSVGAVPIAYRFTEALWHGAEQDQSGTGQARTDRGTANQRPVGPDPHDPIMSRGRVVSQAFTAANAWTPVSPIVAVALETTHAPFLSVLAWAVPMSLLAAVATAYALRGTGKIRIQDLPRAPRSAAEFLIAVLLMVVVTALIDRFWEVSRLGATMLSIILVVTGWQMTLQRPRAAVRSLWTAVLGTRSSWPQQFTLFCAGGPLVAAAVAASRHWAGGAMTLTDQPLALIVAVPVVILILAGLSLYPMVSMAALGAMLAPQVGAEAATGLALALIVGASVSFLVSPLTGLTLLMGDMSGRSAFEVAVRWNLRYGLGFLALGTVLAVFAYEVS